MDLDSDDDLDVSREQPCMIDPGSVQVQDPVQVKDPERVQDLEQPNPNGPGELVGVSLARWTILLG